MTPAALKRKHERERPGRDALFAMAPRVCPKCGAAKNYDSRRGLWSDHWAGWCTIDHLPLPDGEFIARFDCGMEYFCADSGAVLGSYPERGGGMLGFNGQQQQTAECEMGEMKRSIAEYPARAAT